MPGGMSQPVRASAGRYEPGSRCEPVRAGAVRRASVLTDLWSLKTEFSRTIFSSSSISSLGRSAVMKAFTVTEMSSGSCVSDSAVCTTCTAIATTTTASTYSRRNRQAEGLLNSVCLHQMDNQERTRALR